MTPVYHIQAIDPCCPSAVQQTRPLGEADWAPAKALRKQFTDCRICRTCRRSPTASCGHACRERPWLDSPAISRRTWLPPTRYRTWPSRAGPIASSAGKSATSPPSGATAPATSACSARSSPAACLRPPVAQSTFPVFEGGFAAIEAEYVLQLQADADAATIDWTPDEAGAPAGEPVHRHRNRQQPAGDDQRAWARAWWCPISATTTA